MSRANITSEKKQYKLPKGILFKVDRLHVS